jgi:hypothetical protein
MTPQDAVRGGVDYIVVGRPIIEAKDPVVAARAIVADMQLGASSLMLVRSFQIPDCKFRQAEKLLRFPIFIK